MNTTTTTPRALLTPISPGEHRTCKRSAGKIAIIGAGTLGTSIAFTLLAQKICNDLVLIDKNEALARGEVLDIQHAAMYLDGPTITASREYQAASNAKICIITAGARGDDSKKDKVLRQNCVIFKEIIPKVVNYAPECVLIICAYPVDEMSYVAWKLSKLPPHQVIGTGTLLDSAKFRQLIAQKLEVHPNSCQAFIIGEHGVRSVPAWSSVSVGGVRLKDVNPDLGSSNDPEDWQSLHSEVVKSAVEITKMKECGSWGMALSVARIARAILEDTQEIFSLSTRIKGCRHGIEKDVYMSLPCILGCSGVKLLIKQHLNEREKEQLQKSADRMYETQKTLGLQSETIDCP